MNLRVTVLGGGAALLIVLAGGAWWRSELRSVPPAGPSGIPAVAMAPGLAPGPAPGTPAALPVPPVPPRIAQGKTYEDCLALIDRDPAAAEADAQARLAKGGADGSMDGALHCQALAEVALGNIEIGATGLESLAGASTAPPLARASVFAQAGQAWMMADRPLDAARAFGRALALSPDDPDLLIDRAGAASAMEHYRDAVDDLSRALAADPERADALVLRGGAWRHLGQLSRAEDDIDRAMAIDPSNPEALLERGILRQRHGDIAGAREDWERVITLAPDGDAADLAEQNLDLLEAGPVRQ
jgi:regulator of sirC expression with transglutaminase-like and TPR domain